MATINRMYRYYEVSEDVAAAVAARGDLAAVVSVFKPHWDDWEQDAKSEVFRAAADARQYHIIDWIVSHASDCGRCSDQVTGNAVIQIARQGDLEVLKSLHARMDHSVWNAGSMVRAAIEGGHLGVAEWVLLTFQLSIEPGWFVSAAGHGRLAILEWLWAHRDMRDTPVEFVEIAAHNGRLDVLRWLKQHLDDATWEKCKPYAVQAAGGASQLEVVRFLLEGNSVLSDRQWWLTNMKESTSVEFVEYVLDQAVATDVAGTEFVNDAARKSNLAVVKHLVLRRGYWSCAAFALAVKRPSGLEIGRFLYEHAKVRATELQTSLEAEIDFSGINILWVICCRAFATARWLAECVPEVETGETLTDFSDFRKVRFPCTTEAQRAMLACLRARPTQCLGLGWLPRWATDANNFEAFSLLVDMDHSRAHDYWILARRTDELRDSRFLLKLLAVKSIEPVLLSVIVVPVAGLGAEELVDVIFSHCGDSERLMDRRWMLEAALNAVQHGHVGVLQWFHDRVLLLPNGGEHEDLPDSENSFLAQLVHNAARHDRIKCLDWLVATFEVSPDVLAQAMRVAIAFRCVRVVRWLTYRYTPHDLAFSSDDVRLVRKCLLEH